MNLPSLTKAREEIGQRSFVRWYLRFSLSLRNVEEMMAERGLMVDHTTVWRWCPKYGPMIYHRLRGKLKYTTTTWHMDETDVRIAGRWVYLFREEPNDTPTIVLNRTTDMSNGDSVPCRAPGRCRRRIE